MGHDLYRLVYYSRNAMPGSPAEIREAIEAILATSQRNNAAVGITGALMFNSGCFAQVLEGGQGAIETVFERIQRDDRHGEVMVLDMRAIEERGFPSWSMGYVGRSREGQDLFSHMADATGFEAKRMESERVLGILHDLVLEEGARRVA